MYALLDEGATISIFDSEISRETGCTSSHTNVTVKGFGSKDSLTFAHEKVSLRINWADKFYNLDRVSAVENPNLPSQILSAEIAN